MDRWRQVYRAVRRGGYSRNRTVERNNNKTWRNRDTNMQLEVPIMNNLPIAIIETDYNTNWIINQQFLQPLTIYGVTHDLEELTNLLRDYFALYRREDSRHLSYRYLDEFLDLFPPAAAVALQIVLTNNDTIYRD